MFTTIPTIPILMVGAGNLAWHLGIAMKSSELHITQVWSRHLNNAEELAKELSCIATDNIEDISNFNGIILFCIPDHVIPFFASKIKNTNSIIVHTSGSTNISVIEKHASQSGVFYPLQTFIKSKPDKKFKDVPVLIESTTPHVDEILVFWTNAIEARLYRLNSQQRMNIHVAAVFSCNFTNHMISIAKDLAQENNLDFNLLKPLITETLTNLLHFNSKEIQTGPAIRKDTDTIQKHLNSLSSHPDYAKIYSFVTDSIIKMHLEE
jgi:predicted short-subunit dehydrogenase-like oxidoreductase (DUF2520 family)